MANVNRGKQFERSIKESLERVSNCSVYRLRDSMGGFSGVCNIADFIVYKYPIQLFLECKSHYKNTMPLSNITYNQYQGMLKYAACEGVCAGVVIWFIDHDITIYAPIEVIRDLKEAQVKSIRYDKIPEGCIVIKGNKKRIMFDYDLNDFLEELIQNVDC